MGGVPGRSWEAPGGPRGGSQKPAASRRNLLHVSRGVFSNKTRFVFAHEDHLCHRTDFLFEALVAMLRASVFLRRHHTFPRQRLELAAAQFTYRAMLNRENFPLNHLSPFALESSFSQI